MDTYGLEQDLKKMFILYGPLQVMAGWKKVIAEFREALLKYESTTQATQTPPKIVLNETIFPEDTPIEEDGLYLPPFAHKVYTEKELYQRKLQVHKEKIQEKRKEIEIAGVNPDDVLTEENLKKWIQTEKKSYWVIAEETGCSDALVSFKAKSFNILSDVALMIRRKKASLK